MNLDEQQIVAILLKENYITQEDVTSSAQFAAANHSSLLDYLISQGLITKNTLGQAVAEYIKVAYADLTANQPSPEQIQKIPEEIARKYRAVLFKEQDNALIVATDNPQDPQLIQEIRALFPNKNISIAYSASDDIDTAFVHYHKTLDSRF